MVQQTTTLTLGGEERTLLFGVSGFLQYVRDISKTDPFEFMDKNVIKKEGEEISAMAVIDDVPIIVHAGLNCYLDSKNLKNISFEDSKKWCRALDQDTIIEIYRISYSALLTQVKKEALTESANGQTEVNA